MSWELNMMEENACIPYVCCLFEMPCRLKALSFLFTALSLSFIVYFNPGLILGRFIHQSVWA